MRVLFVHDRIGSFGGAEANILVTARELRRRGHQIGLAHGPATTVGVSGWEEIFTDRFELGSGKQGGQLARAIEVFEPDAVYVHKLSDASALRALVNSRKPVVRMVHDHDLCCMRGYKYNYFNRRICSRAASLYCVVPCGATIGKRPGGGFPFRWVSYWAKRREIALNKKFSRLVVATAYMREELLRNGFEPGKIEIHSPVPQPSIAADAASFGERNRIVYAGQIIRGKGVDVLLESLARVRTPFECLILGDGNHRIECERLSVNLGLQERVRFLGFVPQHELPGYYREATLAVMSSLWPEPFGATGLEAMRCGLPVVAFDAGGIREWLIDGVNGYLVPWMDRDIFALRVDELLSDKALARELGDGGRRTSAERFDFGAYIDGLEGLFYRASNGNPKKRDSHLCISLT